MYCMHLQRFTRFKVNLAVVTLLKVNAYIKYRRELQGIPGKEICIL